MTTRVQFFGSSGQYLADVKCQAVWSEKLNGIGQARITIAKTNAALTEELIQLGSMVLIEHDTLGAWGGILDTPQDWNTDPIELTAYSGDVLMQWRSPVTEEYTGTAGTIFRSLVSDANYYEATISLIDVYSAGSSWTEPGNTNLYEIMVRLAKRSGQEWKIAPLNVGNRLMFEAYWTAQRGRVVDVALEEGLNIQEPNGPLMSLQGRIVNDLTLKVFNGSTGTTVRVTDADSIARYGRRQDYRTETAPAGIDANTLAGLRLAESKHPRRTFNLEALNVNGLFSYLDIGNTLRLRLRRYGWTDGTMGINTTVRIKARSFSEERGTMTLVVDEAIE